MLVFFFCHLRHGDTGVSEENGNDRIQPIQDRVRNIGRVDAEEFSHGCAAGVPREEV